MANERKVPVLRLESNLIDQEFDSIKEKFEVEMQKMEEEMSRFRSQLIASERNRLVDSSTTSTSTSSTTSTISAANKHMQQHESVHKSTQRNLETLASGVTSGQQQQQQQQKASERLKSSSSKLSSSSTKQSTGASIGPDCTANWLAQLDSPLIKDDQTGVGGKVLKLRFDVTHYEPEQIIVKTIDNRLQIHARSEEKSENMSMYREYNREFLLPDGVEPELIRSSLSSDGVLTVEAPLPQAASLR